VWGTDLYGTFQGAGGVGGLLFSTLSSQLPTHAPAYDGNGNVIAYVDMATGAASATYDYGAFGEPLVSDGPASSALPFRFSTKYQDSESGLLYYGLRYYNPATGRWLSRDPSDEQGGVNLYGFVDNRPTGSIDGRGDYGRDVHGYFTYFAALAAGASVHDARSLGAYTWGPDASRSDNAIDVIYTNTGDTFRTQSNQHALTGGAPQPLRDSLLANVPNGGPELGRWSHVFQDSYAHVKVKHAFWTAFLRFLGSKKGYQRGETLYQKGLGHALSGTIPDKVSTSPQLFADMARAYYGPVASRFGGKLSMGEYMQYVEKISRVGDGQREEFIKYIVRPCKPGDVNKAFDDLLSGLPRLNLDPDSAAYSLPSGSSLGDWAAVKDWVSKNIN
jgi:RHS repeat-associated protein